MVLAFVNDLLFILRRLYILDFDSIDMMYCINSFRALNSTHIPEDKSHFYMTNYFLHYLGFVFLAFCLVIFSYNHKILLYPFYTLLCLECLSNRSFLVLTTFLLLKKKEFT